MKAIQRKLGIGGHHRGYRGESDEWLTPPEILESLGRFDLDPCAPIKRPWNMANVHFTIDDDGLSLPWGGRVWMNPPYGPQTAAWLERLADHGHGTALIFARTETDMFHRFAWARANAMLFLRGRIHFHRIDGTRAKANAGGPSVLIAYGPADAADLAECGLPGQFITLRTG